MSKGTQGMTEREQAAYYNETHDVSEFDEGAAYPVVVRRNVTISVRFSEEEIEALRREAEVSGVKVTAYIRSAALNATSPVDHQRLRDALRAASDEVARAERLLSGRWSTTGTG